MAYEFQIVHYPKVLDRFGNLVDNEERPYVVEVKEVAEVASFWTREEAEHFTRTHDPASFGHLLGPEPGYVQLHAVPAGFA